MASVRVSWGKFRVSVRVRLELGIQFGLGLVLG